MIGDENEVRGGETSCYAHLLCFECGVVLDGSAHASACSLATPKTTAAVPAGG